MSGNRRRWGPAARARAIAKNGRPYSIQLEVPIGQNEAQVGFARDKLVQHGADVGTNGVTEIVRLGDPWLVAQTDEAVTPGRAGEFGPQSVVFAWAWLVEAA
jgi:hypothetical protein